MTTSVGAERGAFGTLHIPGEPFGPIPLMGAFVRDRHAALSAGREIGLDDYLRDRRSRPTCGEPPRAGEHTHSCVTCSTEYLCDGVCETRVCRTCATMEEL